MMRNDLKHPNEYSVWKAMRHRCRSPKHISFANYGGRGIKVCSRWDSFENFLSDMGPRPTGCSIDRVDNDRDYEPSNCRWATRTEQLNNKRTTREVIFQEISMSLADACRKANSPVTNQAVARRLSRGWPLERALTEPLMEIEMVRHQQRTANNRKTARTST